MIDPETGKIVRTTMKDIRLDEISAVDRPAQPGAIMSIMKRAGVALGLSKAKDDDEEVMDPEDEGADKKKKKNPFASAKKRALLTTPTDGHQHLITDEVGPESRTGAGQTGFESGTNVGFHSHPWMIDGNGVVIVGEAHGHTHSVLLSSQGNANPGILDLSKQAEAGTPEPTDASNSNSGESADPVGTVPSEVTMTIKNEKTTDQEEAVAKQLEDLTKRAERAEKVSELTDAQRGIFKSLEGANADAFLNLSPADRDAEVAKAADANAVVYKSLDGEEFRKSDDPRLVSLAKRADNERTSRLATEKASGEIELRKRAGELKHLPGDIDARMSMVKAIDSIEDPEKREAAMKGLLAQDMALGEAFKRAGTQLVPTEVNPLDSIAKAIRDKNPTLTPEMAMAKALETPEGEAAYAKSLGY
jgi:hypothetical protein